MHFYGIFHKWVLALYVIKELNPLLLCIIFCWPALAFVAFQLKQIVLHYTRILNLNKKHSVRADIAYQPLLKLKCPRACICNAVLPETPKVSKTCFYVSLTCTWWLQSCCGISGETVWQNVWVISLKTQTLTQCHSTYLASLSPRASSMTFRSLSQEDFHFLGLCLQCNSDYAVKVWIIQSDHKLKYNLNAYNFLFISHVGKQIETQQWTDVKVFASRYLIWLPQVMRHISHPNAVLSHSLHTISSLTLIPTSQFCLAVPVRIVAQEEHKLCPWQKTMKTKGCEVGWGRICDAVTSVNEDMLHRVWNKSAFRWGMCQITHGIHIEHLWTKILNVRPLLWSNSFSNRLPE
jgi:hypothetical protein